MKKTLALAAAFQLVASFAHAQDVGYNFDQQADFSKYKTYKWVPVKGGEQMNELVAKQIADANTLPAVELKLAGVDLANFALDGGRQKLTGDRLEITREDLTKFTATAIPVKEPRLQTFLQPTAFMQSDHPSIKTLAAHIVGGEQNAGERKRSKRHHHPFNV